jgi:hypothetical protein
MTKAMVRTCDRCGVEIPTGGAIFKVEAWKGGPVLDSGRLDLCQGCSDALVEFLKAGASDRGTG